MRPKEGSFSGPRGTPRVTPRGWTAFDRQGKEMKCKRTQLLRGPPMRCLPLPRCNTRRLAKSTRMNRSARLRPRSRIRSTRARSSGG